MNVNAVRSHGVTSAVVRWPWLPDLVSLAGGCTLLVFTTWHFNMPAAAWLAPSLLMLFFRRQQRWSGAALALALMTAASFANKRAGWGFDVGVEILTGALAVLPLFSALLVDRYTWRRLPAFWGTLVFPAVYVCLDYALSFAPLGTVFSLAPTQFAVKSVLQLAALAGGWGIDFLVLWLAPVANLVWIRRHDLRSARVPAGVFGLCVAVVILGGELRLAVAHPAGPAAPTVKIAGVTVAHPRKYWDDIIDRGTPLESARGLAPELQTLQDQLFSESERAVQSGAQVIFWSEGNVVLLPEDRQAFVERARAFARSHTIYFAPAYLVFAYGQTTGDNGLLMIKPDGEVAYTYTKTKTWYPTNSDGLLRSIDTPFGRLGTAICFDMDFPGFIGQAARQGVDIMLVPAFDTLGTRPYHTEVGAMRGVDFGFAVVRQTNEGMSLVVDRQGNVLAKQDFFATNRRIMMADVPTSGVRTIYGVLGDFFPFLCAALLLGLAVAGRARRTAAGQMAG